MQRSLFRSTTSLVLILGLIGNQVFAQGIGGTLNLGPLEAVLGSEKLPRKDGRVQLCALGDPVPCLLPSGKVAGKNRRDEAQAAAEDPAAQELARLFLQADAEFQAGAAANADAEAAANAEAEAKAAADAKAAEKAAADAAKAAEKAAAAEAKAADKAAADEAKAAEEATAAEAQAAEEAAAAAAEAAEKAAADEAKASEEAAADAAKAAEETAAAEAEAARDAEAAAALEAELKAAEAAEQAAKEKDEGFQATLEALQAEGEADAEAQAAAEAEAQAAADAEAQAAAEAEAQATAEAEAREAAKAAETVEARDDAGLTEEQAAAEAAAQEAAQAEETPAAAAAAEGFGAIREQLGGDEVVTETVEADAVRSSDEDFAKADPAAEAKARKERSGLSDFEKIALLGIGALVVGSILKNGDRVVASTDDRAVVQRDDGSVYILKNDDQILRQPGSTVETRRYDDGSTLTVVTRADGSEVRTIRDANGRVLRRTKVLLDGSSVVLFDDTAEIEAVDVATLPKDRAAEIELSDADLDAALRRELSADVGRRFSLGQIRNIRAVRELVPIIELDTITFDTGSAAIRAEEAEELVGLGRAMQAVLADNPGEVFLVEGHTDAIGSATSNLTLSDRRAESLALALTEYFDIPPENLIVQGYGESYLNVPTLAAERANRRVAVRRITPLLTASN